MDNDEDGFIDCLDSDCIGVKGPRGAKCCFANGNCEEGAECNTAIHECKETDCRNGADDDGDELTDCLDSDCDGLICGGLEPDNLLCIKGACQAIPKAEKAPVKIAVPRIEIFSYNNILMMLNKCKVIEEEGDSCTEICQAGETGFPTKWEDDKILRCTCC